MSAIAIAGLYTHETNLKIEGFPLPYYPVAFPFDGISGMHSGVGLNLALALGRLGQQVRLATLIGPDEAGDHLIEALPRMGLASDFVARASAATSQSVISLLRQRVDAVVRAWIEARVEAVVGIQARHSAA